MLHAISEMFFGFMVLCGALGAAGMWAAAVAVTFGKKPFWAWTQIWVAKAQMKWASEHPAAALGGAVLVVAMSSLSLWAVSLWRGGIENAITYVWLAGVFGQLALCVLAALQPVSVEESPLA